MSADSHPHDLLVEEDRGSPTRDGPRRTEDLRILLEAMLTAEDADEVVAKNDTEFSRLLAIPRARVASALAVGEQRGVFIRRALPLDSRTGFSLPKMPTFRYCSIIPSASAGSFSTGRPRPCVRKRSDGNSARFVSSETIMLSQW